MRCLAQQQWRICQLVLAFCNIVLCVLSLGWAEKLTKFTFGFRSKVNFCPSQHCNFFHCKRHIDSLCFYLGRTPAVVFMMDWSIILTGSPWQSLQSKLPGQWNLRMAWRWDSSLEAAGILVVTKSIPGLILYPWGVGWSRRQCWCHVWTHVRPNSNSAEFHASVVLNYSCYGVRISNWFRSISSS